FAVLLGQPQQLQVARLENERQRFGEGVIRYARQQGVIHFVEREDLLHVVPQLVNRDVVPLVVHPVFFHPRPQVREVAPPPRRQGMAGAPGWVHYHARSDVLRLGLAESELLQNPRDVLGERLRGRVLLPGDRVQLLLREFRSRLEAVVPEVLSLQLAPEPLLDQRRHFGNQRRGEHLG